MHYTEVAWRQIGNFRKAFARIRRRKNPQTTELDFAPIIATPPFRIDGPGYQIAPNQPVGCGCIFNDNKIPCWPMGRVVIRDGIFPFVQINSKVWTSSDMRGNSCSIN